MRYTKQATCHYLNVHHDSFEVFRLGGDLEELLGVALRLGQGHEAGLSQSRDGPRSGWGATFPAGCEDDGGALGRGGASHRDEGVGSAANDRESDTVSSAPVTAPRIA